MLVKVFTGLTAMVEIETSFTSLRSILNHIKQLQGAEFTAELVANQAKYVLIDSTNRLKPVALSYELTLQDFSMFDTLLIVRDIEGEGEAIAVGAFGMTAGAVSTAIVGAVINIALSIALSYAIQALSPTPEFNTDPAATQVDVRTSNLFNGAPLIREQGGITPLIFGCPFAGGVLISTGITTSDSI